MDICGCSKTQFPLINSRIGNVHLKTVSGSRIILFVVVVFRVLGAGESWTLAMDIMALLFSLLLVLDAVTIKRRHFPFRWMNVYLATVVTIQLVMIYLTGGLTGPAVPIIFPIMVVSGVIGGSLRNIIPTILLFSVGLLSTSCLEYLELIPHNPIFAGDQHKNLPFLVYGNLVYSFAAGIVAIMSYRFSQLHEQVSESLQIAREDLLRSYEERLAMLTTLSREMAHEIKNPLAAIKGLTQLLCRKGDETGHLDVISKEVLRLEEVLKGYLEFSKPIRNLKKSAINVSELIHELSLLLSERLDNANISLSVTIIPQNLIVRVDVARIKQALLNVFLNAIEAMKDTTAEKHMEVRAELINSNITLTIRDTGPGIPENRLSMVLKPEVTTKAKGSGLGLPVSRAVINAHGGYLKLKNHPDMGLEVSIVLPED